MKKLTKRYREWLRRRSERRQRRWKRTKTRYAVLSTNYGRRLVYASHQFSIPTTLCLDSASDRTLSFFHDLRLRTLRPLQGVVAFPTSRRRSRVGWVRSSTDFACLRNITPGAALILAAEYDRMRRMSGVQPGAINLDEWDEQVYATLYQLGFFKLLGFDDNALRQVNKDHLQSSNIHIAPMQCGDNADYKEAAQSLERLFDEVGGDQTLRVQLLGAVIDAIENVKSHAYEKLGQKHRRLIPPLWWVSGSADPTTKKLTLAIYDQGQTIPVTLPKTWPLQELRATFSSLFGLSFDPDIAERDGEAVKTALQMSQTATKKYNRGKGLSKIHDVVRKCPGGRLRVSSRNGHYLFQNGQEQHWTSSVPLMGTFLEIEANFLTVGLNNE
jgi:hypothetical protein